MSTANLLAACICVGIPPNLVNQVQLALRRGEIAARWRGIRQQASLTTARAGSGLTWFVAASLPRPVPFSGLNAATFLLSRKLHIHPMPIAFDGLLAVQILREGSLFLVLQIAAVVAFGSDLVLITTIICPNAAAEYAVALRYFSVVPAISSLIFPPLWPTCHEALLGKEISWMFATLRHTALKTSLLPALGVALLVGASPLLMPLWLARSARCSLRPRCLRDTSRRRECLRDVSQCRLIACSGSSGGDVCGHKCPVKNSDSARCRNPRLALGGSSVPSDIRFCAIVYSRLHESRHGHCARRADHSALRPSVTHTKLKGEENANGESSDQG